MTHLEVMLLIVGIAWAVVVMFGAIAAIMNSCGGDQ
jgi:hypothetical protein